MNRKWSESDASYSRALRSGASYEVGAKEMVSIVFALLSVLLYFIEEIIVGSEHSHEGPVVFLWIERFIAVFFTYELVARWKLAGWGYQHLLRPFFWIDVIAVLPFFIGFFVAGNALHLVRTLRLLRLFKTLPYIPGVKLLGTALMRAFPQVRTLIAVEAMIVIFSTAAIYECERYVEGTAFTSLFDSIWFTAVTVTTVGYGDMTPETLMGRMIALATFMTGLVLFAVFAGVVGSAITDVLNDEPESEL